LAYSTEVGQGSLSSAQGVDAVGAESRAARFRGPLPESPQLASGLVAVAVGGEGVPALEETLKGLLSLVLTGLYIGRNLIVGTASRVPPGLQ
jgi:hypothetical protein